MYKLLLGALIHLVLVGEVNNMRNFYFVGNYNILQKKQHMTFVFKTQCLQFSKKINQHYLDCLQQHCHL
jgi:hypothetical protein